MQRLVVSSSAVVVVDVQERLAAAMPAAQRAELDRACSILIGAAEELGVRILYTEQYPKGLGPTVPELAERLQRSSAQRFEKVSFSAADAGGFCAALQGAGTRSVVVVGMEAHVCVFQTARDLVRLGYDVHVPLDGVCSRRDDHRQAGLSLCERAGAVRTTSETVVFDWLERAGSDQFRAISRLVR